MAHRGRTGWSVSCFRHAWDRALAVCLVLLAATMVPTSADAQQRRGQVISGVFGGFAGDPNAPIDIEADRLVVNDNKKMAVFTGNVKAVQGKFTLRTPRLEVYYSSKTTQGGGQSGAGIGSGADITRLKAVQKVRVVSANNQSATGDEALFDVKAQTVVLSGRVVVTQGKNIITGERLFIDLKTNTTRLDPGRGKGKKPARVKMIIHRDAVQKSRRPALRLGVQPSPATGGGAGTPGTSGWSSRTRPSN